MDLLVNAVDVLPDDFPFALILKNITRAFASESQGNLMLQIYLAICPIQSGHLEALRTQGQRYN